MERRGGFYNLAQSQPLSNLNMVGGFQAVHANNFFHWNASLAHYFINSVPAFYPKVFSAAGFPVLAVTGLSKLLTAALLVSCFADP